MDFSHSTLEIIKARKSYRTYQVKPFEQSLQTEMQEAMDSPIESPFGGHVRIELVYLPEIDPTQRKQLGIYGVIQGAQYFLVGALQKSQYDLEHYGFTLEQLILKATDLDLGTCWLAGTFNRSGFSTKMRLSEDEYVPAIAPIGYPTENRRFVDRVMRWVIKSNARKPWENFFFDADFTCPLQKEHAGEYFKALESVWLAPSAGNSQPWRILKEEGSNTFHFFIAKQYKEKQWRVMGFNRLDLGIGTCHFELAANALSLKGNWEIKDPAPLCPEKFHYLISWNGD